MPPPAPPEPGVIREAACGDGHVPITHGTNVWSAAWSNPPKYLGVIVCAGSLRKEPETGYFLIVRNRLPAATSKFYQAFVEQSGPVRITEAPLGEEGPAHVRDAHIGFESERGTVGYLDLADDSIHITGGPIEGICPAGTSGTPPNCVTQVGTLGPVRVKPKIKFARPGQVVAFKVRVKNTGQAPIRSLAVCIDDVKHLNWDDDCARGHLLPGQSETPRFKLKVDKKAIPGEKIVLNFKTGSNVISTKRARAIIRVR